jgi:multicomponent Na+:H+ antiporter subunit A
VKWPYQGLLAAGVIVAVLSGVWGYAAGSFLKPVRFDIPLPGGGEYGFTSAMVFDLGVYLAVLAIIIAVINELGGVSPTDVEPRSYAGAVLVASRFDRFELKSPRRVELNEGGSSAGQATAKTGSSAVSDSTDRGASS